MGIFYKIDIIIVIQALCPLSLFKPGSPGMLGHFIRNSASGGAYQIVQSDRPVSTNKNALIATTIRHNAYNIYNIYNGPNCYQLQTQSQWSSQGRFHRASESLLS